MDDHAGPSGEAASLFILSFRHRDELLEAAGRGGWRAIAARRAAGVEKRFIASGAGLAVVDGRGAFDEAIGAVRNLADPVEANAAALLVLLSRNDAAHLADVFAAGATHYLVSPFGEAELLQALRFAARHAQRLGGAISRPALSQADAMRWSFDGDRLTLSIPLRERLGLGDAQLSLAAFYRMLEKGDRRAGRAARSRLKAGYGSTAFSHRLPGGARVAHHLTLNAGETSGFVEPLEEGGSLPLHRDPMTGLPDGTAARRWLASELAEGAPGVLLVGLSRLPVVNSLYGRTGGDALLQAAARRIDSAAREGGGKAWVARLAGTEFMVGLPKADARRLAETAERIVAAMERRVAGAPDAVLLGADIGGAIATGEDAGALLRRASAALAEARETGGSAIRLLDGGAAEAAERSQRLATDLRQAIAEDQIGILFQPQVRIVGNGIVGVEALARWRHPELGELGAEALFGAAERAGLVVPLSELVQRRALETAARWPAPLGELRLSINVTAADLGRPGFAERMLARIDASGFPRERLTAEITEGGLIDDLGAAAAALAQLRQGGCRVAVDDFGTGYSSLAYLKALPLDYLKLDRRLSQDIAGSARDRVVVRSVIDMARALGLGVIAEGVETEEQLALLAAEGCTFYQGFLCSGPVASDKLAGLVGKNAPSPAEAGEGRRGLET